MNEVNLFGGSCETLTVDKVLCQEDGVSLATLVMLPLLSASSFVRLAQYFCRASSVSQ